MSSSSTIIRTSAPYLAAAVGFWCFYKLFLRPFLSPLRKLPGRPFKPLVGNMLEALGEEAMSNSIRWMKDYKSRIVKYNFFYGDTRVIVADPAAIKYMLVTNSKNFHRANIGSLNELVPGFVVLLSGEEHHSLRKVLNPAFNSQMINGFVPVYEEMAKKVVKAWDGMLTQDKSSMTIVPAQDFMSRMALDIVCRCGFDFDMQSIEDPTAAGVQSFKRILSGLQIRLSNMLPFERYLPTKKNVQMRKDLKLFHGTIDNIVRARKEKMEEGEQTGSKDLLSLMLVARGENGEQMSAALLSSQVGGFLFAGYETTSMNLTWTLLLLAQHPEIQEKARQEVMSLLPDSNQPITPNTLENLKYLTCVIKESLRLYPPAATAQRTNIRDDYLSGYFIPAGSTIIISIGALHRLPENWEDPESFKPERFLESYDQYKFLPFITGPYMCIGHTFSVAESKVALATILRNFRFTLPKGYTFRRIRQLTVQPSPPLSISISHI